MFESLIKHKMSPLSQFSFSSLLQLTHLYFPNYADLSVYGFPLPLIIIILL